MFPLKLFQGRFVGYLEGRNLREVSKLRRRLNFKGLQAGRRAFGSQIEVLHAERIATYCRDELIHSQGISEFLGDTMGVGHVFHARFYLGARANIPQNCI